MFTGIIREIGIIRQFDVGPGGARLEVKGPVSSQSLQEGASIAVDGVCLTVTALTGEGFRADLVPETLKRTRFATLEAGDRVNLELPLRFDQFLDGHLVQGHVDGVGTVIERRVEGIQTLVTIGHAEELGVFIAEKGSIAVNGVSLTVTAVTPSSFSVALIPTTLNKTNFNELCEGSPVNLEVDLMARYVARLRPEGTAKTKECGT